MSKLRHSTLQIVSAKLRRMGGVIGVLYGLTVLAAHGAIVEYAYDENGRLVAAYAPSGDSAQYVYDAAGNIVQINRIAAGTLALIEFLPTSGPVGTQVTIWGSGFSATPSQNLVTFNGISASVVGAAPSKLVVTVPAGATAGPIAVTVASTSVASVRPFVVTTSTACDSRFTGFVPTIGMPGSAVTISGTSLDSGTVSSSFNGSFAASQSSSSTSLTVSVPTNASSGRLTAAIPPACGAQQLGDFFVPPSGFTVSDIGATGRLILNGPSATVNLGTGKKALYVFDGNGGAGTALYLTASTLGQTTADIRAPDGSVVRSFPFSTASATVGPVYLPVTGGYSIFINPASTSSGTVTLQLAAPDLSISTPTVGAITENANGSFNIPVEFTVTNIGATSTQAQWNDQVYLTPGLTYDINSKSVGLTNHTTALAVNGSYTVNQTYVASGLAPGRYTLFSVADSNDLLDPIGSVVESNEANNVSQGVSVVLPSYPDLAISNSSVGTITENRDGSYSVPVSFTVTNLGTTTAKGSWLDYTYLSRNGVFDSASTIIGWATSPVTLAGGASYAVSQTYTVSGFTPGTYTLFIKADGTGGATGNGSIMESTESNNTSQAISVTLPPYPDLALTNPSVGTVIENQNGSFSIPVSFTVTNLGTTTAQPGWGDYVYLSRNGALDSASTVVGSTQRSTALVAGASYTVNQTFTTSGFSPGSYTLFLKTDGSNPTGNGVVAESNESNNASLAMPVTFPAYPDLAISNLSVGIVTENVSGSFNIPVTFTVTNLGTTTVQPFWYDYGYLSRNGALDANAAALGSTPHSTALAGGDSYIVTQTYVTSGFTPGTYTLFAKTDAQGAGGGATSNGLVTESSESNNVTPGAVVTLPPYPDLAVSNPSVGAITKNTNGTYNIPVSFTVTNIGVTTAQPSWSDRGYLSSNGLLDSTSTSIGSSFRSTALGAGESYAVSQTYVVSGFAAGTYTLFLKADGQTASLTTGPGAVAETDETNNATAGISVTLP